LQNYSIRKFDDLRETISYGDKKDTILNMEPKDFLISKNDQEVLTLPQLSTYIDRQRDRGVANIKSFEIELHKRYAMTAAAFILTLIGVTLSSKKVKGGMGVNIGIGLVLSFTYIMFTTITSTFAVSGYTSPMVAMWIPNIIYSFIAIYLYRKASL
jgi:lipopolysaccharide export system permease protein